MQKIPVSIFTFNELHAVGMRFLENIKPLDDDVFIKATMEALQKQLDSLLEVLSRSPDQTLTKALAEKDHIRDNAFIAFRDLARAYASRNNNKAAKAGQYLTQIFRNVGYSLYREGYSTQTSKLTVLFKELKEKDALESVTEINGNMFYDELVEAQNDFEQVYSQKIEQGAVSGDYPKKVELRKKIDFYMEGIFSYISMNAENNSEVFVTVLERIDELVSDVNRIARARKTRKKNESTEEGFIEITESDLMITKFTDDTSNPDK